METTAPPSERARPPASGPLLWMGAVALATLAAAVLSTANPVIAVVPVALVALLALAARVPLRWSATALLALILVPDFSGETRGQWRSPIARVGDLMILKFDDVLGIPGAAFTGMEAIVGVLFLVWLRRRLRGSRLDVEGMVRPAGILWPVVLVYVGAVLATEVFGLLRGFPLAPWKLRFLLHPVMLVAFFAVAFRGPVDHALVGRTIVGVACYRAVLAFVVQQIAIAETGGPYSWATSHGDSVLFAVAMFLLVVDAVERPTRARLLRGLLLVPLLLLGGAENQRRIFWVILPMLALAAYFLTPRTRWKLGLTRAVAIALPFLILYGAVGWNRSGRIFAPVHSVRTVLETSADRSSYWREVENWNIAMSLRELPLTGVGLGGSYTEVMPNDDVSAFYKEYRQWPHNTYLGLLLLTGPLGFTAIMALWALAIFLSIRSYRLAATADLRVAALACLGSLVSCQAMAWGDLGASFPQYKAFSALAVVFSAKLATVTGAWPGSARPAERRDRVTAGHVIARPGEGR